jgi:hypothetical protein
MLQWHWMNRELFTYSFKIRYSAWLGFVDTWNIALGHLYFHLLLPGSRLVTDGRSQPVIPSIKTGNLVIPVHLW